MIVVCSAIGTDQSGAGQETGLAFEPPHPGVRNPRGRPRGTWSPFTNGIIAACLGVLVFTAIYASATSPQIGPVSSWRTVDGPAGMFTIEVPVGWQVTELKEAGGSHTMVIGRSRWVHALIQVYPRMAEDVSAWGANGTRTSGDMLAYMHGLTGRDLRRQFEGMTEDRPSRTDLGGYSAMLSRMRLANDPAVYDGEQMSGVRATMPHGRAGLLMVALAPTRSWTDFEPTALQIFRSIRFGNGRTTPAGR